MQRHLLIRTALERAETLGVILALVVVSEAVLPLVFHGGPGSAAIDSPHVLERISYWYVYGFTLAQVVLEPRRFVRAARANIYVLVLVAVAAMSILWSVDPDTTMRRSFALGMSTLFGLHLGSRYTSDELLRLLATVLGVLAVLSIVFGLRWPDYGIAHGLHEGSWQGVFTHKNTLGRMMVLSFVVCLFVGLTSTRLRIAAIALAALSVVLVLLSRSTTALVILGSLVLAAPVAASAQRGRSPAVALLLLSYLSVVSTAILMSDQDLVLAVLGRDVTLTGRTMLWSAVLGRMFERPLLGYGYGASWVFVPGPGETVRAIVGWETPHSHNAFLDYSLDMGLFGLLVFLAALVRAARRSLVSLRFEPSGHRWWPITYLSLLLMGNITESGVYQSQFIWALFVAVSAAGTAVGGRTQRLGVL